MNYRIAYTSNARKDLDWWRKNGSDKDKRKISSLLEELEKHPEKGTGKPERLKGELSGYWSRRINGKDRIVYEIKDNLVIVLILSMKGHYSDK